MMSSADSGESVVCVAHAPREFVQNVNVGTGFAQGFHSGLAQIDIQMAVGAHQIQTFHLRGCGQNDVGIAGRIGHHLLVNDGE